MYCYLLSLQTNSLANMPKLTLIRLCFWLCLARMVVSGDLYHQVEGDLVLKPEKSTVTDHITSILWKHGKNKVAEWYKDYGLDIYGTFINCTTLDQTTGELRISGLMKTDSGVYSVEFNSKLLDKTYTLSVIKAVPKPTITSSCNANQTSCTLTCEGDTTDAEPVTYSWKEGEGPWVVGGKLLIVSKSHTGNSTNSYKYICKLNNTVSGEVSEPGEEVFGSEPSNRDFVGVVVTAIVASVFIVITGTNPLGIYPLGYQPARAYLPGLTIYHESTTGGNTMGLLNKLRHSRSVSYDWFSLRLSSPQHVRMSGNRCRNCAYLVFGAGSCFTDSESLVRL
uniref:Ig-like domain-containing protein n=1 Tax=Oncorhynchus tshawytscha TaxID=74940 RepID=A0A8C8GGQ7_ONCTS